MNQEVIRDIRKRCRMAMNGVASTSMRSYGLEYKLNFGVEIQKIKAIATRYESSKSLAEDLWLDGTRELKILATLLYPQTEFTEEAAMRWIQKIPNQEIREQLGFNLFRHLPYTSKISRECCVGSDKNIRTSGYWFWARSVNTDNREKDINIFALPYIWSDIGDEDVSLRNAAILFLKQAGRTSKENAEKVLEKIADFKNSDTPLRKEVYDSLAFEYEFFFEDI